MDYKCFRKKTVFITGGVSGIGRSSAISFAKYGAKVFIIDINETEGNIVIKK